MGFKIEDAYRILNSINSVYTDKNLDEINVEQSNTIVSNVPAICKELTFIELGEQEFKVWDQKNNLLKEFMQTNPRTYNNLKTFPTGRIGFYANDYMMSIFKSVASIDAVITCDKTLKYDLGFSLSDQKFYDKFDIVSNNGTTEHVGEFKNNKKTETYNPQYEAFLNIHNLVNKGGLMFHTVPFIGVNHGAFQYDLSFFRELANKCNYKVIYNFSASRDGPQYANVCLYKQDDKDFIDKETFDKFPGIYER